MALGALGELGMPSAPEGSAVSVLTDEGRQAERIAAFQGNLVGVQCDLSPDRRELRPESSQRDPGGPGASTTDHRLASHLKDGGAFDEKGVRWGGVGEAVTWGSVGLSL